MLTHAVRPGGVLTQTQLEVHTTAVQTDEAAAWYQTNQSACSSCLQDSSGKSTDNNWENNIH